MAAVSQASSSLYSSIPDVRVSSPPRTHPVSRVSIANITRIGTSFCTGSPLNSKFSSKIIPMINSKEKAVARRSTVISIRCEQGIEDGNGLDVWLGRLAMVGFAVAISVEVSTGKGLLENFGLTSPLPTVALAVTAVVGVLTAIFIFQSASGK